MKNLHCHFQNIISKHRKCFCDIINYLEACSINCKDSTFLSRINRNIFVTSLGNSFILLSVKRENIKDNGGPFYLLSVKSKLFGSSFYRFNTAQIKTQFQREEISPRKSQNTCTIYLNI